MRRLVFDSWRSSHGRLDRLRCWSVRAIEHAYASYRPTLMACVRWPFSGVVGFHAAPPLVPRVCRRRCFFVISFLISGNILRALTQGASFRQFYARRVKRISRPSCDIAAVWSLGWLILLPDEFQLLANTLPAEPDFS